MKKGEVEIMETVERSVLDMLGSRKKAVIDRASTVKIHCMML
jgi:hypothetical protein